VRRIGDQLASHGEVLLLQAQQIGSEGARINPGAGQGNADKEGHADLAVEKGEQVDVYDLFEGICASVVELNNEVT